MDGRLFNDHLQLGKYSLPRQQLTNVSFDEPIDGEGLPVKVGIRPDFFNDKAFFSDGEATFNFSEVDIELVEPMGFDKEVLFHLGDDKVKARLDLRSEIFRGEKMDLLVDLSRVLLFDEQTQRRL
jgi:multiple sugar transport system ATP-binding protein